VIGYPRGQDGAILPARNYPPCSAGKNFLVNPLLTKLVRSRWLDIGLVHFLQIYGPRLRPGPETRKKELDQYPAILTSNLWSITHIYTLSYTDLPSLIHV